MAAVISQDAGQPCPRYRIHATIGTVMVTAMPVSASSGESS